MLWATPLNFLKGRRLEKGTIIVEFSTPCSSRPSKKAHVRTSHSGRCKEPSCTSAGCIRGPTCNTISVARRYGQFIPTASPATCGYQGLVIFKESSLILERLDAGSVHAPDFAASFFLSSRFA